MLMQQSAMNAESWYHNSHNLLSCTFIQTFCVIRIVFDVPPPKSIELELRLELSLDGETWTPRARENEKL